jgi:hypothetical protein
MIGLSQAQSGVSSAFDKMSNLVGEQQTINQAAVDRKDGSLVLDLKTALSKATSLEEVKDLSGKINEIESSLQTNKARQEVMGATAARTLALQGQITAANTFKANLRDYTQTNALREVNDPVALLQAQAKAADAPTQIAYDNAALNAKVLRQPNELLTEDLKSKLEAAKGKTDLTQYPAQALLASKQLTENLAQADDTTNNRGADVFASAAVKAHLDTATANRDAITQQAIKLNQLNPGTVPMNADGTLALGQMNSSSRAGFNAVLKSAKLPTVESLETGDTSAKQNIIAGLKAKGYSAANIARVTQGLDFSLNTGPIAPIGGDLSAFNGKIEAVKQLRDSYERQYGIKAEPGSIGEQLKGGLEAVDAVLGTGSNPRSEIYKERIGHYLQNGGIKMVDPVTKEVSRVMPSPDQLKVIINGIDKKWHNTRLMGGIQNEIDNALNSWEKSATSQEGAQKLMSLDLKSQLNAIRQAEERPLPPVLSGKK